MHNLFKNVKVMRISTEIAAGSAESETTPVDTKGYGGLAFLATFGELTGGGTRGLHAEMAASTTATFVDVEGSATTGGSTGTHGVCTLLDLGRPRKRYYTAVVDRATQNSVITGVWAFLYNPESAAVTQSTAADGLIAGAQYLYFTTTGASTGS